MPDIFTLPPKKSVEPTQQPQSNQAQQVSEPAQQQPIAENQQTPIPQKPLVLQTETVAGDSAIKVSEFPEGTSLGLLSAFRMHPKGIKFVNQEKDEHIILFLRRHFIINVPWILLTILFSFLPPIVYGLIVVSNLDLFTLPPSLIFILIAFYYLIIFNYALMNFIIWFYHVGIVTPKRLLDLDVYNILSHHLAETEIADVVDVSYMQRGFFQSFFNYGDVPIQTQAIKANFEFETCPKPAEVSDIITDLRPHRPHAPKPNPGGNNNA